MPTCCKPHGNRASTAATKAEKQVTSTKRRQFIQTRCPAETPCRPPHLTAFLVAVLKESEDAHVNNTLGLTQRAQTPVCANKTHERYKASHVLCSVLGPEHIRPG